MPKWAIGYQVAAASITTGTALFTDNAAGDQTSYEQVATPDTAPAEITGLYSFTPTYPTVSRIRLTIYGTTTKQYAMEYWNGAAWATVPWILTPIFDSGPGWWSADQTITPTAAQYWRLSVRDSGDRRHIANIGDFRLLDGGGTLIVETGGGGGGGGSSAPRLAAVVREETFGAVVVAGLGAAAREETFGATV